MLAISVGDEVEAMEFLRVVSQQRGFDSVEGKQLFCKWPALTYVLLPESREWWTTRTETMVDVLGGRHTLSIQAAQALLRARASEPLQESDALLAVPLLRTVVPVRWGVELAVALVLAGKEEAASTIVSIYGSTSRDYLDFLSNGGEPASAAAAKLLAAGVLVAPSRRMSLTLFGPMTLRADGIALAVPGDRSPELLAFLATRSMTTKTEAGAALWPSLGLAERTQRLALTIEHLCGWLEPELRSSDISWFVRTDADELFLVDQSEIEVDIRAFGKLLDGAFDSFANRAPSKALEQILAALDVGKNDFLLEFADAAWATSAREAIRERIAGASTRAGELLVARGEFDRAESLALTALAQVPTLQSAWRLRIDALQKQEGVEATRVAAALCQQTFRESRVELEPATRELLRTVSRVAQAQSAGSRATYGWESLTRTEDDVVALLLGGRTNRQIGVQLGISPRTVESHLAHVYDKLGIRTRVELAAEAARRSATVGH